MNTLLAARTSHCGALAFVAGLLLLGAPLDGQTARAPEYSVTVMRDVSATWRVEQMRDEFLATAAHEFKTPLAVIKAYAQLMQKRDPDAQALTVIQRQVERLNRLVHHLLDASRLSVSSLTLALKNLALKPERKWGTKARKASCIYPSPAKSLIV